MGTVFVSMVGWKIFRRLAKISTWAMARVEARVPIRRVRGGLVEDCGCGGGLEGGAWSGGWSTFGGGVEVIGGDECSEGSIVGDVGG